MHPNINAGNSRLRIRDRIGKSQSEWEGAERSSKNMGSFLHKLFKVFVKELKNALMSLEESGS